MISLITIFLNNNFYYFQVHEHKYNNVALIWQLDNVINRGIQPIKPNTVC